MSMVFRNQPGRRRPAIGLLAMTFCLWASLAAFASGPLGQGVLVHLQASQVASFDARLDVTSVRLNPHRDLYLVTSNSGLTDQQLLNQIKTDPAAGHPELNTMMTLGQSTASVLNGGQSTASVLNGGQSTASVLNGGQSTASVLNGGQSTASVLNGGQSTASVLNGGQSTASVLNGEFVQVLVQSTASVLNQSTASVLNTETNYYGTRAPTQYVDQPLVSQVASGPAAHALATGKGVVVALIDNGVDQFNPVLRKVLLRREGYNFYDNTPNWSAWADLGQSTASVLNGEQSTASVLNSEGLRWLLSQSTASVLNGCTVPTANSLNGSISSTVAVLQQSTASVLNGQSTASVLNREEQQLIALIEKILACDPDFGHGTSVAGLIHLIAPEAKILPIKAFGPGGTADAAVIYESITYAMDHGANVINLSFSSTGLDPNVQAAIAEAVSKGIIVSAAAGNSGSSDPVYPASLPGVVGVGAVDGCNAPTNPPPAPGTVNPCIANPVFNRAAFSNFDPPTGIVDDDVAAPGVQLLTTFPGFGLLWATVSGTSFSTPLVAGEAALLRQLGQAGADNRGEIENTANPSIPGDADGGLGHGLVQVLGALRTAPPPGHGENHRGR
ncbi:MAG TPA: S8 family serine peptidase [Terriglobales bacterium]|nr:S8 family serine peptidase [Terriglobales bacterium]